MPDQLLSDGIAFGNLDAPAPFAGVASMFDADLVANNPDFGAYRAAGNGYVGKSFASPKVFSKAIYYGWTLLRFAQQSMAWPLNCAYVKTFDLPNSASADWDNTQSVLTIGQRVAAAMRPMMYPNL